VVGVVFVWPLAVSVAASFTRAGVPTLGNYTTVWRLYLRDVGYTLAVSAGGTALTFALAIVVCGWLRVRAFAPVEFLLKVPLFVPFVVVGLALAWKHLGLAALLLVGAFRAVDESHLEAARNFGAGTARLTRDVLMPMSAPSLAVSAVLIFSSMLASFSIPLMMSRGGGAQMLMIDVHYRFGQHGDFETAAALGVVGYLMAMGAALVYLQRLAPVKRP